MMENKNLDKVRAGWAGSFILELKILVTSEQCRVEYWGSVCRDTNPGYNVVSHSDWMSLQLKFGWWAAYCWTYMRLVAVVNSARVLWRIAQFLERHASGSQTSLLKSKIVPMNWHLLTIDWFNNFEQKCWAASTRFSVWHYKSPDKESEKWHWCFHKLINCANVAIPFQLHQILSTHN
jgi:hypothetical protein